MRPGRIWIALSALALMAVAVSACGSSSGGSAAGSDTDPAGASTEASGADEVDLDWRNLEIVDVSGESFTLADLEGRPVFVENFATWCPTCRAQLGRTQDAAEALGNDAVFVILSVETDLSRQDVADYAHDNGFTSMRFAVMSEEMLAASAGAFGTSAVNPPSTPHVVIAADGTVGDMETGSISAADIEEALRAVA